MRIQVRRLNSFRPGEPFLPLEGRGPLGACRRAGSRPDELRPNNFISSEEQGSEFECTQRTRLAGSDKSEQMLYMRSDAPYKR